MPSPLEERLFLTLKRLEQTSERLAKLAEGITSDTDIPKILRHIYKFTERQTVRELRMEKRLEALETMTLKLLRSNSALVDKLQDFDNQETAAVAKDFVRSQLTPR